MNILRRVPAIMIMIGIFIISALPANDPFLNSVNFSDKIQHVIAYFVLGITFCMWVSRKKWLEKPVIWGVLVVIICTIFGVSDEYHQSFVPGRSGNDMGDLAADFTGGLVSIFFYLLILKMSARCLKDY